MKYREYRYDEDTEKHQEFEVSFILLSAVHHRYQHPAMYTVLALL